MKLFAGAALAAAMLAMLPAGNAQADPAAEIDAIILETMKQSVSAGAVDGGEEQVSAEELYRLAQTYLKGWDTPEADLKRAARLLAKAAAQGDSDAQNELGEMYFFGRGVREDEGKAEEFFRKAADQGHEDAMTSLGWIYFHDSRKDSARKLEELEKEVARRGYDVDLFRFTISRPAW